MPTARSITKRDVALGNLIRSRRLTAGLTQEDLANALGVTFQQVQKYEKGTNRVTFNRMQEIAGVLEESIDFFTTYKKPLSEAAQQMQALMSDHHAVRLMQALVRIDDSKKRMLLIHMAEELAEA